MIYGNLLSHCQHALFQGTFNVCISLSGILSAGLETGEVGG